MFKKKFSQRSTPETVGELKWKHILIPFFFLNQEFISEQLHHKIAPCHLSVVKQRLEYYREDSLETWDKNRGSQPGCALK